MNELTRIERTRLALWALAEAEARITAPPHLEAEVMRAWEATQFERALVAARPSGHRARLTVAVAKWVLVPAVAAGMSWAAVRAVMPVTPQPDVQTAGRATQTPAITVAAREVAEQPAPPAALAVAGPSRPGAAVEKASPVAAAPQRQSADGSAAGTVLFIGELVGAGERIRMVRMRVPRAMLASLGVSAAEGSESVFVDVLVGEDGVARAVQVEM